MYNQLIKSKSLHLHAFNFDPPRLRRLVQHFLSHININYWDQKCHIRECQCNQYCPLILPLSIICQYHPSFNRWFVSPCWCPIVPPPFVQRERERKRQPASRKICFLCRWGFRAGSSFPRCSSGWSGPEVCKKNIGVDLSQYYFWDIWHFPGSPRAHVRHHNAGQVDQ